MARTRWALSAQLILLVGSTLLMAKSYRSNPSIDQQVMLILLHWIDKALAARS